MHSVLCSRLLLRIRGAYDSLQVSGDREAAYPKSFENEVLVQISVYNS